MPSDPDAIQDWPEQIARNAAECKRARSATPQRRITRTIFHAGWMLCTSTSSRKSKETRTHSSQWYVSRFFSHAVGALMADRTFSVLSSFVGAFLDVKAKCPDLWEPLGDAVIKLGMTDPSVDEDFEDLPGEWRARFFTCALFKELLEPKVSKQLEASKQKHVSRAVTVVDLVKKVDELIEYGPGEVLVKELMFAKSMYGTASPEDPLSFLMGHAACFGLLSAWCPADKHQKSFFFANGLSDLTPDAFYQHAPEIPEQGRVITHVPHPVTQALLNDPRLMKDAVGKLTSPESDAFLEHCFQKRPNLNFELPLCSFCIAAITRTWSPRRAAIGLAHMCCAPVPRVCFKGGRHLSHRVGEGGGCHHYKASLKRRSQTPGAYRYGVRLPGSRGQWVGHCGYECAGCISSPRGCRQAIDCRSSHKGCQVGGGRKALHDVGQ